MSDHAAPITLDSDLFRIVATPNGRVRCPVLVYSKSAPQIPVAVADANLASQDERAKIIAQLAGDSEREDATTLLLAVAAEVARHRTSVASPRYPKAALVVDEPWPTAVSAGELLAEVKAAIEQYVALPPHAVEMLSRVGAPYLCDGCDGLFPLYLGVVARPRVREVGAPRGAASPRPRRTDVGGYTAAALYRRIARNPATTMLLDELDTRIRGDGGEAIRGVLNTGFQRSGKVTICVGDEHEDKDFPTFCPKVLAGIGHMWDSVASRSIPVRMSRASRDELRRLRKVRGDRIGEEFRPIRRKLLRWAADALAIARGGSEVPDTLGPRQSDVWRPLFTIGDHASGIVSGPRPFDAPPWRCATAVTKTDNALLLLADVRELLGDADAIYTRRLLEELPKRDDRPWSEYRHDKPITARGVASLLGRFGVKPQTVRLGAETEKGTPVPN